MAVRISRHESIAGLRAAAPLVLPSLLACDFARLAGEIELVEAGGAKALHLDVMDGHFVPNLSIGVPIVEAIRRITRLPLDVHLMIDNPAEFIEPFRAAGADGMTIHVEVVPDPRPLLERIRELGAWAGLAFNPATPIAAVEPSLPYCDLVLVMSVEPGFGGQEFDEVAVSKLQDLSERDECDALLEVDGGISEETIGHCAAAGASLFVAGTSIFQSDNYADAMRRLHSQAVSNTKQTPPTV